MKTKAVLMALAMMTTALAGCTSGTDGVPEVDEDALNELIQDNLQDFINNTTVVVNQDFHYHNNTTVNNYDTTNEYSNTTNVDGGEVNNYNANNYSIGGGAIGNGTGGSLYLLDIQFTLEDLLPGWGDIDHRNNTIDVWWEYFDYLQGEHVTSLFTIQCSDYYLIGSQPSNGSNNSAYSYSYWEDNDHYEDAWDNMYNSTISNMLAHYAYADFQDNVTGETARFVRLACDESYVEWLENQGFDNLLLFEIPLPEGISVAGIYDSYFVGMEQYVWTQGMNSDCEAYITEYSWEVNYRLCPYDNYYTNAFNVYFTFETMSWSYHYGGWVGGDSDSNLEVFVNNIVPGFEYRLIAYFQMTSVMPLD